MGYTGGSDTVLAQGKTDAAGKASFRLPEAYTGAALLQIREGPSMVLLLNNEPVSLRWSDAKDISSVQFTGTKENEWFRQGFLVNDKATRKLAGWRYLQPLYTGTAMEPTLAKERQACETALDDYIATLPAKAYARSYLAYRQTLQYLKDAAADTGMVTKAEQLFRATSLGTTALYHSGLLKDILEAYLDLQGKQAKPDRILPKLNAATDAIMASLNGQTTAQNEISGLLFRYYEKYNFTQAAEHLALSMLGSGKCTIDDQRTALFEQYRKMAVGQAAPALSLPNTTSAYHSLADINSSYRVVVFGASWCEECKKEIPQLKEYVTDFDQKYHAKIVFVSLDQDKAAYESFIKDWGFITACDFKGWGSELAKSWYVIATPSIFIVEAKGTIVAKPVNVIEAARWLGAAKG